ncbi:MAG: methylenetetrahydrofolate reductase [Candidatus Thermoplasmatota archaeon]|jgi:methylenetetrahydrofolate reductase (NADPH)|nr:methylenetetrahydrofolate reductase [Anaerolineae bacterium]MDD5779110.1 methylenetetrahydrofolate reductase [Candidatus Thermoplasmatota archaeon]MDX9829709.1 methylenetetrahydrofolate reductase [Anaerolineae bacterium]
MSDNSVVAGNGYIVGSKLEKALKAGYFVATGELGPPQSADRKEIEHKANFLKGIVESVNITDNQTAVVRMSSISVAVMLMELGIEPNIQMTCRDRNRIAIQSDLLGAYALGCRNLLCLTGDHQTFGNHPQSKNVHDLDSISLLQAVRDMRDQKVFQCGEKIKGQEPRFFLGAAANPFADPFEFRPYRLAKKAAAGADFIQTQIIFNVPKFQEFMRRVVDLGAHEKTYILAGVAPIKSLGGAKYMATKVPGMEVDPEYITRMENATKGLPTIAEIKAMEPKEAAEARKARQQAAETAGIGICVEIINECKKIEGVAGVHIMAIEWEQAVDSIVSQTQIGPKYDPSRQAA